MKIFIMFTIFLSAITAAYGLELTTACPAGYKTISRTELVMATTNCPANYKNSSTVQTCLTESPGAICWMYAPTGVEYNDNTGTYEFTDICPLE